MGKLLRRPLLLVPGIAIIVWATCTEETDRASAQMSAPPVVQDGTRLPTALSEVAIAERDARFLNELEKTKPRAAVKSPTDKPRAMLSSFERMLAMGSYFNRDKLRRDEMEELLKDRDNVAIAVLTITDLDYAQYAFNDKQALARVFSIKLLEEEARTGDPTPLYEAARTLAQSLSDRLSAEQPIIKAQDRDLADLVTAAVGLVDEIELAETLPDFLTLLGYRQDFHPEVKKAYDDAAFFRLLPKVGRAQAKAMVAQALGETEH